MPPLPINDDVFCVEMLFTLDKSFESLPTSPKYDRAAPQVNPTPIAAAAYNEPQR